MQAPILLLLLTIALGIYFIRKAKKPKPIAQIDLAPMHQLLIEHVPFYQKLNQVQQQSFRTRAQHFLDTTIITPVGEVTLTELDKLFVAASAIIPIFSFPDWTYNNLNEVLIYPEVFSKGYEQKGAGRNIMGMVGNGAMNRMMILSLPALRAGFNQEQSGNTGIHEFVHLLDKADGATDGVPEYLLPHELIQPWLEYAHQAIAEIHAHHSEINPYAATSDAEFFAVLSEYFFQKPELLAEHHPELFGILNKIYQPVV